MSSFTEDLENNTKVLRSANGAEWLTFAATFVFVCAIVILDLGKAMPFVGHNTFLTFLGGFFMLIPALVYLHYVLSARVVRHTDSQGLRRSNRGMMAMGIVSLLIAVACIVSLIFT